MNKQETANASADDEGVASEKEAVDDGEPFKEGESSQGQYPCYPVKRTVLSEPLCRNYGMCLTINNVFVFCLFI